MLSEYPKHYLIFIYPACISYRIYLYGSTRKESLDNILKCQKKVIRTYLKLEEIYQCRNTLEINKFWQFVDSIFLNNSIF